MHSCPRGRTPDDEETDSLCAKKQQSKLSDWMVDGKMIKQQKSSQ
jgi:hypothetical protein